MGDQTILERRVSIYLTYGGLVTPLGITVKENFQNVLAGRSGIQIIEDSGFQKEDWPQAKLSSLKPEARYKHLLNLICDSLHVTCTTETLSSEKTLIIVSSTKGEITALPSDPFESTRKIIKDRLRNPSSPLIVSNACISGVLAISTGADYLKSGKYDTVIVIGIDALSDFITYGFQSLYAMSQEPAKPFDKNRKGISLGEAAGAIILTKELTSDFCVELLGSSSSNDANHISGPSRTGEGLYRSVKRTLERSGINQEMIDFISAHGTGTLYNDDMESIAFERLHLDHVPINSLKGYYGHTLGAAGILETIITMKSMEHGIMIRSKGYEIPGTTSGINVLEEHIESPINYALKTASGFGGGNASLILKQVL